MKFKVVAKGRSKVPNGAPSGLTLNIISDVRIDLSWTNNSTDEDGLAIQRSTDGVNYTLIHSTLPGINAYSDSSLSVNTSYYYRIYAFKGTRSSGFSNIAIGTTFTSQYELLYNTFATKPNAVIRVSQNKFIRNILSIWNKIDFLAIPCSHVNSGGESLLWWTDPTKSMVNHGSDFTAFGGLKGDAISKYFDTIYNEAVSAVYRQNDATFGVFFTQGKNLEVIAGSNHLGGIHRCEILFSDTGENYNFINDATLTKSSASVETEGFLFISRLNATQRQVLKNTLEQTITANSIGISNFNKFGLCRSLDGVADSYSSSQIGLIFGGAGLTFAEMRLMRESFITYLSEINTPLFKNFIAFGDSITQGHGCSIPVTTYRYSKLIATSNGVREVNMGVPSESVQTGFYNRLDLFRYLDRNAKIFILGGTNDIYFQLHGSETLANFTSKYASIIDRLISYGYPASNIYMGTITDCTGERQPYLASYNAVITSIATSKGITLIDCYGATVGQPALLDPDGLHLNDAGHIVLYNLIDSII